jgi:hypothetical protein
MANTGPMPQAELLSVFRRVIAAARAIEQEDRAKRDRERGDA